MRVYVTGGHGFVGRWLVEHLRACGDEVVAPDESVDVTDGAALALAMAEAAPQAVYHLAAFTHVGQSWADPEEVMRVNVLGTLHVLEAARALQPCPRVLLVSSAEVYGIVEGGDLPLDESQALAPATPYAASKVAAEYLGVQAYLGYGLEVMRVRSFNHVGPGQSPTFAVPGIAQRILVAQREGGKALKVGNLSPRRDFTDVRDVVRAYRMVIESGRPGAVYNVCSGHDLSIAELAERLIDLAGADLSLEVDPELLRPADLPVLQGDPSLLAEATGWQPTVALDDTLADVLAFAAKELDGK
ncbi:MAG: GDP-mannose 4,6-dehydratase [Acidimicrobiales bacterium]